MNLYPLFLHLLQFRVKCGTRDLPIMLLIIREFLAYRNREGHTFLMEGQMKLNLRVYRGTT